MTILKVFIITVLLTALSFAGLLLKMFFKKKPDNQCENKGNDSSISCGCGGNGSCHNRFYS